MIKRALASGVIVPLLWVGSLSLSECNRALSPPGPVSSSERPAIAPTPNPPAAIDFTETKATRPWRIAFVPKFKYFGQTGKLSAYWERAWQGAQQAGADFGVGVSLVTSDVRGETDADYVEPQIRLIAALIARGELDGLVVAPFDSNRLAPVLDKAIAAGIPTVAMDTPVNSDRILTVVAFDNFAAGRVMGRWVVQRLGGAGTALILDGPRDQHNATERRRGFLAGLQSGNIDILGTAAADWEVEPARQIVAAWLQKYSKVGAILAANDNMAIGASLAVAAAQRSGILVTGFDASDAALAAIRAGGMSATVDQEPGEQARLAIQLLVRHREAGKTFPAFVDLPTITVVTAQNMDGYTSGRGSKAQGNAR